MRLGGHLANPRGTSDPSCRGTGGQSEGFSHTAIQMCCCLHASVRDTREHAVCNHTCPQAQSRTSAHGHTDVDSGKRPTHVRTPSDTTHAQMHVTLCCVVVHVRTDVIVCFLQAALNQWLIPARVQHPGTPEQWLVPAPPETSGTPRLRLAVAPGFPCTCNLDECMRADTLQHTQLVSHSIHHAHAATPTHFQLAAAGETYTPGMYC